MKVKNVGSSELSEEFREFMNAAEVRPSAELSERVFDQVAARLSPPLGWIFLKLVLLQIVVGAATLFACPQFGVSFGTSLAIFDWLHEYSFELCMGVCGAFFLGTNAVVASLVLTWDEVRSFGGPRLLSFLALGGFALLVLHLLAPAGLPEGAAIPWGIGAALGGVLLFSAGRRMRIHALKWV